MGLVRLGIFASLLLLGGVARAGDDLRAHLEKAESSYALGDYGDAAKEYEAAFKIKPQLALLYNAAQAHRLAGDKDRALQLYINYIRVYGDRVPNRHDVEVMIEKLKNAQVVDHGAQTAPPTGTVPTTAHPEPPAPVSPEPFSATKENPTAGPSEPVAPPPTVPAPSEPAHPGQPAIDLTAPPPTPITRRPVFWVALGAAVAVIAAGIAVTAVYASGGKDPVGNLNPFLFGR